MAWWGLQHDGATNYNDLSTTIDITGDFAWIQWLNLETKATDFHYFCSTGGFTTGEFNATFRQATNQLGINWNGGAMNYMPTAVPYVRGTLSLVAVGKDLSNLKIASCPKDGSETRSGNLQFYSGGIAGKTWQFMRRGDANVDRYSKGLFSQPLLLNRFPTTAEMEAVAAGADPLTTWGADVLHYYPMTTGTGTSVADTEGGPTLDQQSMPTDDSQWVLIEGAASAQNITITAVIDAETAVLTPTIAQDQLVTVELVLGEDSVYAPELVQNISITFDSVVVGEDTVYAPELSQQTLVYIPLVNSEAAVYDPTLTYPQFIEFGLIDSTALVYTLAMYVEGERTLTPYTAVYNYGEPSYASVYDYGA